MVDFMKPREFGKGLESKFGDVDSRWGSYRKRKRKRKRGWREETVRRTVCEETQCVRCIARDAAVDGLDPFPLPFRGANLQAGDVLTE
jgi:hypothetical protein